MSQPPQHQLAADPLAPPHIAAEIGRSEAHAHAHRTAAAPLGGFSLLRLSALERLAGVAVVLALLWALVLWALH